MKSLMELYRCMLDDLSMLCSAETTRDWLTITRRVKHEGVSFLTITLSSFCDDFERSLDIGYIDPTLFKSFKKRACLPAFLQGFTGRVFDMSTGRLLEDPDVHAISGVRQLCRFSKKALLPCTEDRVEAAFEKFKQLEVELRTISSGPYNIIDLRKVFDICFGTRISKVTKNLGKLVPRHGPGATADKVTGNSKYLHRYWHDRLEPYFPVADYCYPSVNGFIEDSADLKMRAPRDELPVRVIQVPKTLKTPRIIAIEPVAMQYAQQAIASSLITEIEKPDAHGWRPNVNFTDQTINQELAMLGSKTGSFATIDLSDASDRVTAKLVSNLLNDFPDFRGAVFACRSTRANVNGVHLHLRKFASMGSALCFPIESMVFYVIAIEAVLKKRNLSFTRRNVQMIARYVYVYGDDIIVPTDEAESVAEALETYHLKVNRRKSFWTGKFRESCGVDAYNGVRVTPVYLRRMLPTDRKDNSGLISAISLSNQLYRAGLWRASDFVKTEVEKITGKLPLVTDRSSGLGWTTFKDVISLGRWNEDLHRFEVRTLVPIVQRVKDVLTGYPALLKVFLHRVRQVAYPDGVGLEESERRGVARMTRRWVSPC